MLQKHAGRQLWGAARWKLGVHGESSIAVVGYRIYQLFVSNMNGWRSGLRPDQASDSDGHSRPANGYRAWARGSQPFSHFTRLRVFQIPMISYIDLSVHMNAVAFGDQ
jgi:hypothetical protein